MNKETEHLQELKEIRSLMERSSRFISLSGLSGVFAGIFALAGAYAAYHYLQTEFIIDQSYSGSIGNDYSIDFEAIRRNLKSRGDFYNFFFLDAFLVVFASLGVAILLSARNAKKKGQKMWDNTSRRMLVNMAIPMVSGALFCLLLLKHGHIDMIAPSTLVFYGMALLNASKYTLNDIRYLGLSEIVAGLIASWYTGYGLLFWALGFGLLHIVYGAVMYNKYERKP